MCVDCLCGCDDFFIRRIEFSVTDIVLDRAGEQEVILSVIGLVMRVGIAYVLAYFTPLGYIGIFIGTPASWALNSIFGMIRYKSGKWKEKCLIKQREVVEG